MHILQKCIYLFNDTKIRKNLFTKECQKKYEYVDTIFCKEISETNYITHKNKNILLLDFFKTWKKIKNKPYILFTVAYLYEENLIHYCAFIFIKKERSLIVFDPGYNLYLHGKYKIIPIIYDVFHTLNYIDKSAVHLKTICKNKSYNKIYYGLQYDGSNQKLPADAFCQMWTLFFLLEYINNNGNMSFFNEWCKIKPKYRHFFLIQNFLIPTLHKMKKCIDIREITSYLLMNLWIQI